MTAKSINQSNTWRTQDVVLATVLGVVCGLLFLLWNGPGGAWYAAVDATTPGLSGLGAGFWLIGGVVGGLIIRKPGAALYVELLASVVSALVGSQWGVTVLFSGAMQGLGAEAIFALFCYRKFNIIVAALAGAAAGVGAWFAELFISPNLEKSGEYLLIYLVCLIISGIVLAGLVGWSLVKVSVASGVLNGFAVARDVRKRS